MRHEMQYMQITFSYHSVQKYLGTGMAGEPTISQNAEWRPPPLLTHQPFHTLQTQEYLRNKLT